MISRLFFNTFFSLFFLYEGLVPHQYMWSIHRTDDDGRKEFRERNAERDKDREREKERRLKEKERLRRQDEERRRRRERQDGENSCRKREEDVKKEKKHVIMERRNGEDSTPGEKFVSDNRKEEGSKRERLRNKVRAAKSTGFFKFYTFFLSFTKY